jgi:TP901 family phage tail tape measure protein
MGGRALSTTSVGYATLDVIPSVRGLQANLEREMASGLAAAGKSGGVAYGTAAGGAAASGFQSKFRAGMDNFGGRLFAGLGLAVAGKEIIGLQADFEASINTLGVAADLTSSQMQEMADFAKKMGSETVFSAGEAADAMVELAKAGLKPAQIEAGALQSTMAVAATEGLDLARSAQIVSNAMTTFGIEGEKASEVADALAGGSKASTASVDSLSQALSQVGGSARDAGLTLQDTVAALSAFDQEGIKGSDAGTSLKTMLSRLVPQTDRAASAMENLGLHFTDANGQFLPLADIAEQLQKQMGGLSDAERTAALNTIFGTDARRAALALMHQGRRGIEEFTAATSETGTAAELAAARMDGTAGAIERMKGSLETAGLSIGETVAPAVVGLADGIGTLADGFTKLSDPVKAAALAFGALKIAALFDLTPQRGVDALSGSLSTLRTRLSEASAEYRSLRSASIVAEGAGWKFQDSASRTTAALGAIKTGAAGAGSALRKGFSGALSMVGGPWGAAFIAGTAVLTHFYQESQEAKARVDELTDALDQQTGSITKQAKELAYKNLQDSGAIDLAKRYGIELDTLRDAALGNADAQASVNDALNEQMAAYAASLPPQQRASAAAAEFTSGIAHLREAIGGQNEELAKARDGLQDHADFMAKTTTATDRLAGATVTYSDKIGDLQKEMADLLKTEEDRADLAVQSRRDQLALLSTMEDARKEAAKGERTLNQSTEAGKANWSALLDLADQWNNSTGKVTEARGAYQKMRQQFIDVAEEMGATQAKAERLADQLLKLPTNVPIKFRSEGYQERMAEIESLKQAASGIGTTIDLAPRGYGSQEPTNLGGGGGGKRGRRTGGRTGGSTSQKSGGVQVNVGNVNVTDKKSAQQWANEAAQQGAMGGWGG